MKNSTTVERKSGLELVVTRVFNAPPRLVFAAWTKPELMKRWWAPKSSGMTLASCEMDVRSGGRYRLEFDRGTGQPLAFFGKYLEVIPNARLVWSNEESEQGSVTTLTFEDKDGQTLLTMTEVYPSKEALDQALAGMEDGMGESFMQLDQLLAALDAGA